MGGKQKCRRIARFRMGSEMRDSCYWREERNRLCRKCGKSPWEGRMGEDSKRWWRKLRDEREGEGWLKKLEMATGGKGSDEEGGNLGKGEKDVCVNGDGCM